MDDKLTVQQLEEVLVWVDKFDLSKPSKYLNRDFSDGVLVAEILKRLFPKIVELHNYAPRCSIKLKISNWMTLNRKVLKKLDIFLTLERMQELAESKNGCIELLLYEIMTKSRVMLLTSSRSSSFVGDDDSNTDIMMVNVSQRNGDKMNTTSQKMIVYSMYEDLVKSTEEKDQAIAILTQKNTHLENLLKLKSERIEELQNQLNRKTQFKSELNIHEYFDIDSSTISKEF